MQIKRKEMERVWILTGDAESNGSTGDDAGGGGDQAAVLPLVSDPRALVDHLWTVTN